MNALLLAKLFACAFFAAVFLQSGLDKVGDWKGNLDWLLGHFSKTIFKGTVPLLLAVVTMLELAAGVTCLLGVGTMLFGWMPDMPATGLGLACLTFVLLITGQRIAKDYAGAATIATYFAAALFGLWLTSLPHDAGFAGVELYQAR
jgi:uncharacterized membrane protein YphA (DoxX/SURF4 family)